KVAGAGNLARPGASGARRAGHREPAPEHRLGPGGGDRRSLARLGHGDLRDAARQPRCLGGFATSGDRTWLGGPLAGAIVKISLAPYIAELDRLTPLRWTGQVTEVVGLLVESRGPNVAIGDFCEVRTAGGRRIRTQVIGFRDGRVLSMPLEESDGLQLGDPLAARSEDSRVEVGPQLLGRVIDGFGKPMDDGPAIEARETYSLHGTATNPLDRPHITQPLVTGIRAIDALLPCGKGQRIGLFGGSGVGKSTLLGSMSRHNSAD